MVPEWQKQKDDAPVTLEKIKAGDEQIPKN
jgi:hypothetical protein